MASKYVENVSSPVGSVESEIVRCSVWLVPGQTYSRTRKCYLPLKFTLATVVCPGEC